MPKPKLSQSWDDRFIRTLNQDYRGDPVCLRITANEGFARVVARMIKRYVDSRFTKTLYADRKKRIWAYRATAKKAIDGLEAAAALYRVREPEAAALFMTKAAELHEQLLRADVLLHVEGHGRLYDYGIRVEARTELEKYLGPVSYVTLANLVNAACNVEGPNAEGDSPIVDADMIRKNLDNFLARNPFWPTQGNSNPSK
jgi:hypothetical protein